MSILSSMEPKLGGLEKEYRQHFLANDKKLFITGMGIAIIINLGFIYNDYKLLAQPEIFWLTLLCRISFLIGTIPAAIWLYKSRNITKCDLITTAILLLLVFCLAGVYYLRTVNYSFFISIVALIICAIYFIHSCSLAHRIVPAFAMTIIFNIITFTKDPALPSSALISFVLNTVAANAVGIALSVRWNNLRRGQFKALTESKQAQEALGESRELFFQFMDMLPHRVFIKDAGHKVIYVNQFSKDRFRGDHWLGKDSFEAISNKRLAEEMHANDNKALAEGQITIEEEMPDASGDTHIFHTTKFGIPRADGTSLIGGIGLDITDQVKAREALLSSEEKYRNLYKESKETEERYHSLLESTLDAIVTYDMEGRVTYVNNAFTELFGWVKEELAAGVPYTPDSEREVTMRNVMQVIREGIPLKDFETNRYRKGGSLVNVSISASRFHDHEGNPAGMLVILRDISQRKQAEKRLAEALETAQQLRDQAQIANQAKSEFVANMSHEIRTPMNGIMGMTDLALKLQLEPKLRDYLTKIKYSSRSLLGIVNDILDFSKIEAGRLDIESVRFDLRSVIANMSDVVCASEASRDIEFLVSLDPDIPAALIGDPLRLAQVLNNLANNAVKFTPSGEVLVRVESVNSAPDKVGLKFSVKDTGIGIEDGKLAALFDPFTQADGSTTRRFGGSGLGLTICKRLVELMGGNIEVQSEKGKGSVFSFQLEFNKPAQDAAVSLPTPAEMQGMRVLIVDDNATSREILLGILESYSFEAVAVESGEAALEELIAADRDKPYGLVLLDWKMPGLDGIETARRIDNEERLSGRIPKVIMITAFGTEEVRRQAEEAGLNGFLSKPVHPSTLFDAIMNVFGKPLPKISRASQAKKLAAKGAEIIRGARILVAEDNEVNQQVAKEILEYAGASVEIAETGKAAFDALYKSEFDAVLMDIQMPEMDGLQATRLIRRDNRFRDLPIIAMTAHAMAGDREKCLEAGMNDHVTKPINTSKLFPTLIKWITHRTAPAESGAGLSPPEADGLAEEPWEELEGFNLREALDRLGIKWPQLRKLLLRFHSSQSGFLQDLLDALAIGDTAGAKNLIHTIKGASSNLGAEALHNAAVDLESIITDGSAELLDAQIERFAEAFNQAMNALASLETRDEADQISLPKLPRITAGIDKRKCESLIIELAELIKSQDSEAKNKFEELRKCVGNHSSGSYTSKIEKYLSGYDFPGALSELNELARALDLDME